jgi:2-polyprenyl-6-methoxyphenol hydroxylase-like FAD-dependent oxidoreductase
VAPGERPSITFEHSGEIRTLRPRLIVGADGRGSQVGRQSGMTTEKDAPTHVLGGLLVDDVPDWPTHVHSIGLIGGRRYYVFHQGSGRVRLYLTAALANRRQITGEEGNVDFFLRHFDSDNLPHGRSIAAATQAGPLNFYANADHWAERPIAPGIVLIGDAAGATTPLSDRGCRSPCAMCGWYRKCCCPRPAGLRQRSKRMSSSAASACAACVWSRKSSACCT